MKSSALFSIPLVAAVGVSAQTLNATYAAGLLQAFKFANLTEFASIALNLSNSTQGIQLLTELAKGKNTILAPTDSAISAANLSSLMNPTVAAPLLSYHVIGGNFTVNDFAVSPNHTIARTFLNSPDFVQLEGGLAQALVVSKDNDTLRVRNQDVPVDITAQLSYENLSILTINSILQIPGNLTRQLSHYSANQTLANLQKAGLATPLSTARGVTVFAPADGAFATAASALSGLSTTALSDVLMNHVINGTTVYTSLFNTGSYASAAGQPFQLASNQSGTFVTMANVTARVVLSDILTENGVVHIIDTLFTNQNTNGQAAQSAFNSYSAAAATAATAVPTGAVGQNPTTTASGAGSGSTATTTNTATNGAVTTVGFQGWSILVAVLTGVAFMV